MRIGLFTDTYLPVINGVVTSVVTLREGLIEQGHDVFVISTHSKLRDISYEQQILRLPGLHIKSLFDNNLSKPFQVRGFEIVKSMNLDIIHIHSEFGIGGFAHYCGRKLKLPIIYTYHTTWEDYTHYVNPWHFKTIEKIARKTIEKFSKQFAKPAKAVITPSNKTKELLKRYGIQKPIHVIPTGLDLSKFTSTPYKMTLASEFKQSFNIKDEDIVFGFVGRLGEEKNLEMVISAISQVNHPNLKFVIVGHGPLLEPLKEYVIKNNLSDKVILTGPIPNSEIEKVYLSFDAFISASMTETQGLTFIEAMASGCVVFASDREVIADACVEGISGFYFDDELTLIQKLNTYIQLDDHEKKRLKKQTLQMVLPYKKEVFVNKVSNLYESVLSGSLDQYEITYCQLEGDLVRVVINNFYRDEEYLLDPIDASDLCVRENCLLDEKVVQQLTQKDMITKGVQFAIKKLVNKDYSTAMMKDMLLNNFDLDESAVSKIIERLVDLNYLNDGRLCLELIERYRSKGYGLVRIYNEVGKYKFEQDYLDLIEIEMSKNQEEDLHTLIQKLSGSLTKGSKMLNYTKIKNKLIQRGFEYNQIQSVLTYDGFDYDETESVFLEAKELVKKGFEPYKIRQKLYQKGYQSQSIQMALEEIEHEN